MASADDVGFSPEGGLWCLLRLGGLKVRLAQVDYVGESKGKEDGKVFGNDQR